MGIPDRKQVKFQQIARMKLYAKIMSVVVLERQ
jgi:hypothetical protein